MPPSPESGRAAWPRWASFLVVALLVVLDQATKEAIFDWLGPEGGRPEGLVRDADGHLRYALLGEWLGLKLVRNSGAAFGILSDFPHFLVIGRAGAVLLLAWLLWKARSGRWTVVLPMILVLSGALGNLLDNLWVGEFQEGRPYGAVRDFIDVWFHSESLGWNWHYPAFNVADSCITVGAILWVLSGVLGWDHAQDGESDDGGADRGPGTARGPGEA